MIEDDETKVGEEAAQNTEPKSEAPPETEVTFEDVNLQLLHELTLHKQKTDNGYTITITDDLMARIHAVLIEAGDED